MLNEQNLVMEAYSDLYESDRQYGKALTCHKLISATVVSKHFHRKHPVIDVGCGRGHVMREMLSRGFQTDGTEPCEYLLKNDLLGLHVFPIFISELREIKNASYDIAFCVNVADHLLSEKEVPDALSELSRISNMLVVFCVNADNRMRRIDKKINWWVDMIIENTDMIIEPIPDPWHTCDLMLLWKDNENSALYTKKPGSENSR